MRPQRDVDAVNGDTWYKNYQIKECQGSNKSSLCNVKDDVKKNEKNSSPAISALLDDLDERDEPSKTSEELPTKHHDDAAGRINGENMKVEHLFPVSDHRDVPGSNYSPNQMNIEARLSAKQFLAKQQNAVHEIEMKHSHLDTEAPSKGQSKLNGNQLPADTSSNSNFPFTSSFDTSSGDKKRSSGQKQEPQRFDDQLEQKKNDLYDEADEKLSKKEQQGLETLHRVKRVADVNIDEINRLLTDGKFEEFLKSQATDDGEQIN